MNKRWFGLKVVDWMPKDKVFLAPKDFAGQFKRGKTLEEIAKRCGIVVVKP